jgi:hypothetical protein
LLPGAGSNNDVVVFFIQKETLSYVIYFLTSQVKSATDASNFDEYPPDEEVPADDLTGWDKDF